MRLLSLELHNIKSYHEPTRIEFTPGLNAVCGLNGSGKTTVLEAIGYVLFDFLPYNRQAFVREGQKSGTIRLRFLADDDREYEIVRKVGSGAQYFVIDPETGIRVVDRGPDVLAWIQSRALGIDAQTDMQALFKNAVGVPQGLMTADFLGAASVRKSIFDPLLRVEEYRKAYDELRDTMTYLREGTAQADVEIARLEAETDRIPGVQDSVEEHRDRVQAGIALTNSLASSLSALEARRSELDAVQEQLIQLEGDLRGAQYEVGRCSDAQALAETLLESARAAHRAVVEAQPGYVLFRQAEASLVELDQRRAVRDGLRASLAKVKGELDGTLRQIERLESDLQSTKDAARAAAGLDEQVDRQIHLEREQHEVAAVLGGLADLDKRRKASAHEIAALQRQAAEREARLVEARAARTEAEVLPAAGERVRELWTALALLEPMVGQLTQVTTQGKTLKEQARRLTDEVRQRDELRGECERLRPQSERLEAMQSRQQELRDERARVSAALQYQDVARKSLEQRHCPLLELQCPVVTSDVSVLERFSGRTGELEDRSREIEGLLSTLAAELSESQRARDHMQQLQVRIAALDGSEARLAEIRKDLDACIARHNELTNELQKQGNLREQHATAVREERRLQARKELGQLVGELESTAIGEATRLRALQEESTLLGEQRSAMMALQERLRTIERELASLGDPRKRQSQYLGEAGRQAEVEAELTRELQRRDHDEAEFRAFYEQLLPFETLDQEIAAQHDIITTHRPAYEAYLQYGAEAAQVSAREAALQEALHHLEMAREQERAVSAERETTAQRYAAEEHEELKRECQAVNEELVAQKTKLQRAEVDLRVQEEELARLRRQHGKLIKWQEQRGELGRVTKALSFIRETIKSAGPAVTETLLAHISQGANDIFSEIMDDHTVELRWDRDYEVLAQRGAEIRKFNQLSGGEQMSAALAVRLALLKEMSEVDFAFFDEPTQNMDGERRTNLANQIGEIRGFDQLIVISHDDTFEHHTENLIRLAKIHEETQLETG